MAMLWYQSWLETRQRFWICLGGLVVAALMVVSAHAGGLIHHDTGDYGAYVWSRWYGLVMAVLMPMFALIFSGIGVVPQSWRAPGTQGYGGVWFVLALPVRRRRVVGVRTLVGAAELTGIGIVGSMLAPAMSALAGRGYPVERAAVFGAGSLAASLAFFGVSTMLAALLDELWHGIGGYTVLVTALILALRGSPIDWLFSLLRGSAYFHAGTIPWMAIAGSLAIGAAGAVAALALVERRDY